MNKTAKIITACATCSVAIGLCAYVLMLNRTEDQVPTFSNIQETEPVTQPTTVLPENWYELYEYQESPKGMTERAKIFLRQNKDIAGWISLDNTKVNYPFVLDPGAIPAGTSYYGGEEYPANSYYLDHDLNGGYARGGTLFMDYRNVFGYSEVMQSDNIVIYGHNMANNTMFGSLRRYRQDYSFYDESPFIDLSSNYKDYQYIIFGCMITSGNWYTDFRYWDMEDFATEEDFNNYVEKVRKGSLIDTGVDVQYGDKLLTLSTCYASEDNSRFIIVGRRLRDDEIRNDVDSIARTPEYIEKKKEEEASKAAEEAASREASENSTDESTDSEEETTSEE